MALSLPTGFSIAAISNATVADPVCEDTATSWTASYKTGQDFHVKIGVPDTDGTIYGLNQTLLLAIRIGTYSIDKGDQEIQLWRTPQQNAKFDFKGWWLDTAEPADDGHGSGLPGHYYSTEAMTEAKKDDGNETNHSVTLRMRKTPKITLPTQIRRKDNPDERMTIKQLDVQEYYLLSLFRDEDLKAKIGNGNEKDRPKPLIQWTWEHKSAWGCTADGKPQYEPGPGFAGACKLVENRLMNNFQLKGPSVTAGESYDCFRVLGEGFQGGEVGEASEWEAEISGEWEACDM